MNKKLLQEFKERLEQEKTSIEGELKTFAKKNPKIEGDWNTLFPKLDGGALEEAADEVEEYSTLLPLEFNLELKLRNIDSALEKIKKGKYGICEKCNKSIPLERLKIYPSATTCNKCKK